MNNAGTVTATNKTITITGTSGRVHTVNASACVAPAERHLADLVSHCRDKGYDLSIRYIGGVTIAGEIKATIDGIEVSTSIDFSIARGAYSRGEFKRSTIVSMAGRRKRRDCSLSVKPLADFIDERIHARVDSEKRRAQEQTGLQLLEQTIGGFMDQLGEVETYADTIRATGIISNRVTVSYSGDEGDIMVRLGLHLDAEGLRMAALLAELLGSATPRDGYLLFVKVKVSLTDIRSLVEQLTLLLA